MSFPRLSCETISIVHRSRALNMSTATAFERKVIQMAQNISCHSVLLTEAEHRDAHLRLAQAEALVSFGFNVVATLRGLFRRRQTVVA